jgi:tetratricopeptide (TPR) repeat protein
MLSKDMTKVEIEEQLKNKGDFVKIDHLNRLLAEKGLPIDKRKFVSAKLAEIYEAKGMFSHAAKIYSNIAIASVTFSDKIKNHMKEAELYIKGGQFEFVDDAIKKAIGEATGIERENILTNIKAFYRKQGEVYEKEKRRSQAVKLYEKLLQMNLSVGERQEVKTRLIDLYEKTGKIREYFALKNSK